MYYVNDLEIQRQFSHTAYETKEDGYMINVSVNRASAMADAAILYCEGNNRYIPNGNFSDAECSLFEIFARVYREGKK